MDNNQKYSILFCFNPSYYVCDAWTLFDYLYILWKEGQLRLLNGENNKMNEKWKICSEYKYLIDYAFFGDVIILKQIIEQSVAIDSINYIPIDIITIVSHFIINDDSIQKYISETTLYLMSN